MTHQISFNQISEALNASGFEPHRVLEIASLPAEIVRLLPDFGQLPKRKQCLLLLGNSGIAFWEQLTRAGFRDLPDPVDTYTVSQVDTVLDSVVPELARKWLYPQFDEAPDSVHLPLQTLGEIAGWHQPSPLGIGIHPQHGLWFAYRGVVLMDIEWPEPAPAIVMTSSHSAARLCDVCITHACVEACPAGAIQHNSLPGMGLCSDYRLSEGSRCQTQCLARNACPEASTSRYHDAQIVHHYSISLRSMKQRLSEGS